MKYTLLFIAILILASFSRLYHLGSFPNAITWDEAAIGYNAYSIATVHRDEWLVRMPLSFRSFGDYKSPLNIYLTAPFVRVLGLNALAVRLPIALAGIGLVVVSYLIAKELFDERLALLAMLLTALSPWAIGFSRIAFESMLATFLVSLGVLCWLRVKKNGKWFVAGAVCFALSLYAYHSAKVVAPLLALVLLFQLRSSLKMYRKWVVGGIVVGFLCLAPLAYGTFFGKSNSRALSTTILTDSTGKMRPLSVIVPTLVSNYLVHLSPSYLLMGKELNYRQSTREMGVLSVVEFIGVILGLAVMLTNKKMRKYWWIPAAIAISILPAALGSDVPHANRALLGLPWFQLLAVVGCVKLKKTGFLLLVGAILATGLWYGMVYTRVYASTAALKNMTYGYKDAVQYAITQEPYVDRVYFTNTYQQAYIFILFYKHMNPIEYRGGGLANYDITDHAWGDAQGKKNVLVVGTKDEFPSGVHVVKDVTYPDGQVAFRIVRL